jgi:Uma2 family endonuclease
MVTQIQKPETIIYPDSDGEPMAENTEHFELIIWLVKNLELVFADQAQVFVIGDLLWYPVEGNNKLRQAPDAMVAFDRPKGYRGSYKQWEEDNIAPQVVFEILSPGNRLAEMIRKFDFYQRYGVEEYYVYNPRALELSGWIGGAGSLEEIPDLQNWISPRLGIRFEMTEAGLQIYRPDQKPFISFLELDQERQAAETRAQIAEQEVQTMGELLEQERVRSQALANRLRELGIEPDSL